MKNLSKNLSLIGLIISAFTTPALAGNPGNISGNVAGVVCLLMCIISFISTFILVSVSSRTVVMALFASNAFFAVVLGISYVYFSIYNRGIETYLIAPLVWFTVNTIIATFKVDFPHNLRVFLGYGAVPLLVCGALFCVSWKITPVHINENPTKQEPVTKKEKKIEHKKEDPAPVKRELPPVNKQIPPQTNKQALPQGASSLEVAIMEGDKQRVAQLIAQGIDVNNINSNINAFTPLMIASIYGNTEIVKQLLAAGADVNKRIPVVGSPGEFLNALQLARANKRTEVIEILLAAGAVESGVNKGGEPQKTFADDDPYILLLNACLDGDTETVEKLLREGAKPTPNHLKAAAQEKQSEVLKQLLSAGININKADDKGEYPFLSVISFGTLEDVKLFVESGADLTAEYTSNEGGTIGPALVLATLNGDLSKVRYLVEQKADINITNKSGSTPLLVASSKGHRDIVKFLLENRAGVNITNRHNDTPLMLGAASGDVDLVKLLLDAGAKVNAQNKHNDTPMMFAAENGKTDVVKLLLEAGANVNFRDADGDTALALARQKGHNDIVELLKKAGAFE